MSQRAGSVRPRLGWRAVAAAAALLTVATGCTSAGGGGGGETRILRVLMTDDWVTPPFLDAVRQFERTNPGVKVVVDRGPIGRMADAVRAGISSGDPPDLVQGHAHAAAGLGLAQPLDDLWAEHVTEGDLLPGAIADVTWAGRRFGLPLDTNAMAVLYNADHFSAAGLSPPGPGTTFAQFESMARALTSTDGSRRALAVALNTWATYGWIRANGGEVVTVRNDGSPDLTLDAPATVDAVSFLARLVHQGLAFGPTPVDARSADAFALFRNGQVSMHTSGSWDLARVRAEAPEGRWGVALMPTGSGGSGTAMGGSSLWVPVGSPNRDLAFELMLLITSDPYSLRFAAEEGRLPVRPGLFSHPTFADADLQVFLRQLATAHPPVLGAFHEASQAFEAALAAVLVDGADPSAALVAAQRRAEAGHRGP